MSWPKDAAKKEICSAGHSLSPENRIKGIGYCKLCSRVRTNKWKLANPEAVRLGHLRRRYGVSLDWYKQKLVEQDNKCAICFQAFTFETKDYTPHVDHDHVTKEARGLLCGKCNTGLGSFKDDIKVLSSSIKYLEKHGKVTGGDSNG